MDFRLGEKSDAFRAEIREFLAKYLTQEIVDEAHATGTYHSAELHRHLAEAGYLAASWPVEYGGQGRDPLEMVALTEEMVLAGAPTDGMTTTMMIALLLRLCANEQLREEILPGVLRGEILMCLGYSEPDSGSDVAAARTRAAWDGEQWIINGQKMWTSLAQVSDYAILLTRTNPDVAKHAGLTMFLVPLSSDGVEIKPVATLGGQRTNMTFYTDVRLPDHYRIGEVDGGWQVMQTALVHERNGKGRGLADVLLRQAVDWARTRDASGCVPLDDPVVRIEFARVAVRNEVAKLLGYQAAWAAANDAMTGPIGSMGKLYSSESYVRAAADLLDLLGPAGVLAHVPEHASDDATTSGSHAPAGGWIEYAHRKAAVTTIYQGTSEIQRSIIAERGLGLPRSRSK